MQRIQKAQPKQIEKAAVENTVKKAEVKTIEKGKAAETKPEMAVAMNQQIQPKEPTFTSYDKAGQAKNIKAQEPAKVDVRV